MPTRQRPSSQRCISELMTCTNCGQEITLESSVAEEGYLFCNSICRHEWRTKGKPTPFAVKQTQAARDRVAVNDLEFPVDPPGFENRKMCVRLSYWVPPKIYLDGKLLHPVKKGFLGRVRDYTAVSNFGKEVPIRLKRRALDQIPALEIGGQPFLIARALNAWEYVWMGLPALLMVLGGLIAPLLGGAALFSNSILMRRVGHWIPRYVLTGVTTVMACVLTINVITSVTPALRSGMVALGLISVDRLVIMDVSDANRHCPLMIDDETRADSISAGPGRMLTYHITLVNHTSNDLDVDKLREGLRPGIIKTVESDAFLKVLREHDVTFVYSYSDKNHRPVLDLTVTAADYR